MWLPTPTDESVEKFKVLAKEEFGLDLTEKEARDTATRLLQIHYLLAYAYRGLALDGRERIDAEERPSAPPAS